MSQTYKSLASAVESALGSVVVKQLLFTTFNFERKAFEDLILPRFFGFAPGISPGEINKQIQLNSCDVALLYDAKVAAVDSTQDIEYQAVPITLRRNYCFHPKLTLAFVSDALDEPINDVVIFIGSANLSQAGWAKNIECCWGGRFSELTTESRANFIDVFSSLVAGTYKKPAPFQLARGRLDELARQLPAGEVRADFYSTTNDQGMTFDRWVARLSNHRQVEKLSVLSPYYSQSWLKVDAERSGLQRLRNAVTPERVALLLPEDHNDDAAEGSYNFGTNMDPELAQELFLALDQDASVDWCSLADPELYNSKNKRDKNATTAAPTRRRLHAKLYELVFSEADKAGCKSIVIAGSVNATDAAWEPKKNIELAVAFSIRERAKWFKTIVTSPDNVVFSASESGDDTHEDGVRWVDDVFVQYDWKARRWDIETHSTSHGYNALRVSEEAPIEFGNEALNRAELKPPTRGYIELSKSATNEAFRWLRVAVGEINVGHSETMAKPIVEFNSWVSYWQRLARSSDGEGLREASFLLRRSDKQEEMVPEPANPFHLVTGVIRSLKQLEDSCCDSTNDGRTFATKAIAPTYPVGFYGLIRSLDAEQGQVLAADQQLVVLLELQAVSRNIAIYYQADPIEGMPEFQRMLAVRVDVLLKTIERAESPDAFARVKWVIDNWAAVN